jgi:hypothetical protein
VKQRIVSWFNKLIEYYYIKHDEKGFKLMYPDTSIINPLMFPNLKRMVDGLRLFGLYPLADELVAFLNLHYSEIEQFRKYFPLEIKKGGDPTNICFIVVSLIIIMVLLLISLSFSKPGFRGLPERECALGECLKARPHHRL